MRVPLGDICVHNFCVQQITRVSRTDTSDEKLYAADEIVKVNGKLQLMKQETATILGLLSNLETPALNTITFSLKTLTLRLYCIIDLV